MTTIEVLFPVTGRTLPVDHGYHLYAGLSHVLPRLHDLEMPLLVGPVRARSGSRGVLDLAGGADLRLRIDADRLPDLLPLAGSAVDVDGQRIRLGVPRVLALEPAPTVAAKLVVITSFVEPAAFLQAVQRQLTTRGVHGEPALTTVTEGERAGEPRRRVVRVRGRAVVGFGVIVSGLSADDSVRLQASGLGGKHKMGCGYFLPVRPRG